MQTICPYVISEAHPDYKRPYVYEYFGTVTEDKLETFFIEKLSEFILERFNEEDIENISDIESFWYHYYDDSYMGNEPWQAFVFIHNEWINYTPTDIQVFNYIKKINSTEDESREINEGKTMEENNNEEDNNEDDDNEEQYEYELTQEDIDIQNKMREYFEKEIQQDEGTILMLQNMNQAEQLMYVLNKCMINIPHEKYLENRELFHNFINMISRFIEKDIADTTNKLEIVHDEKESERLGLLTNTYASILQFKYIINSLK